MRRSDWFVNCVRRCPSWILRSRSDPPLVCDFPRGRQLDALRARLLEATTTPTGRTGLRRAGNPLDVIDKLTRCTGVRVQAGPPWKIRAACAVVCSRGKPHRGERPAQALAPPTFSLWGRGRPLGVARPAGNRGGTRLRPRLPSVARYERRAPALSPFGRKHAKCLTLTPWGI